ncbi:MAG TPA: hypothetical protein VIL49_03600, partial [Capillimicrobium sp.]
RITRLRLAEDGRLTLAADRAGTAKAKVLRKVVEGKGKRRTVKWKKVATVDLELGQAGSVTENLRLRKAGRYRAEVRFVAADGTRATASTGARLG